MLKEIIAPISMSLSTTYGLCLLHSEYKTIGTLLVAIGLAYLFTLIALKN